MVSPLSGHGHCAQIKIALPLQSEVGSLTIDLLFLTPLLKPPTELTLVPVACGLCHAARPAAG